MANILVTGGAGYIGSHACKALAAAGLTPVTYDNLARGHAAAVKWGPLEIGDISDAARLAEVIRAYRPKAVMHFAALAYVGESVAQPELYYRNNLGGVLSLIEAMREKGVDRLVFSSTCATYGEPAELPISEDCPQAPISPYGASKLMVERVLQDFAAAYGLSAIALRYFNAAGADPDGEIGEDHDPEPHLIPLVLEAASNGCKVTVNGGDYDTPDGSCIRDYLHVSDIASAHLAALQALGEFGFQAYNLGRGDGASVLDVIEMARKVTGRPIAVATGPRRPGDPAALLADPSRAIRDLGWAPRLDLEDMVRTAWAWRQGRNEQIADAACAG
jgi:UDP-arabinose 4-epimerase